MGYELLEALTDILNAAGLPAGEEYPAGERVEILSPVAAVGLRELDAAAGEARFSVRVLSPRILGGWCCQVWAAKAAQALQGEGLACETDQMEYLSGSDCFCVSIMAAQPVVRTESGWTRGRLWQVFCGEQELEGVSLFRAVRELGRRFVGGMGRSTPEGITSGSGGWKLELRQKVVLEPEEGEEPFVLTVRQGTWEQRYSGCCWDETEVVCTQGGLELIRKGFAMEREVLAVE